MVCRGKDETQEANDEELKKAVFLILGDVLFCGGVVFVIGCASLVNGTSEQV